VIVAVWVPPTSVTTPARPGPVVATVMCSPGTSAPLGSVTVAVTVAVDFPLAAIDFGFTDMEIVGATWVSVAVADGIDESEVSVVQAGCSPSCHRLAAAASVRT
jgi:hypothetical protein